METPAPKPICATCKVEMEVGLIPESTYVLHWQPGPNERDLRLLRSHQFVLRHGALEIDAWRCPQCGELKLFAHRPFEY
jgi:hypothetical protein